VPDGGDLVGRSFYERLVPGASLSLAARSVELRVSASLVFVDVLMGDDGAMGSEALPDPRGRTPGQPVGR
jgi:hypothetical protein